MNSVSRQFFLSFFLLCPLVCSSFFLSLSPALAAGDLFIDEQSFRISPKDAVVHKEMTIYVTIKNTSNQDMKGVIRAFDVTEGRKIDVEQTFTAISNSSGNVFLNYTPKKPGVHDVDLRMIPWEDYAGNDKSNDKISKKFYADFDTDNDGIGNQADSDDDNDGVSDSLDRFPLNASESKDNDGDGIGDNRDDDDDNDGIKDSEDAFPFDAAEANDTDGDGIGNNDDDDDDGDGVRDAAEKIAGTDPLKKDTDDDGVDDGIDVYPLDKRYQYDTDKDGQPNAEDEDDDGDNIPDSSDLFPLDKNEWSDFDGDGIGDFADPDDDNDGLLDEEEKRMNSDPFDPDTDKDGVIDGEDALPTDPNETKDSDNDGVGDNADTNNNNKGPVIVYDRSLEPFESGRGEVFSLDLSHSYDPEGEDVQFLWEILDASGDTLKSSSAGKLEVTFWGVGKKNIRLTVRDVADETRVENFVISVYWSQKDIWIGVAIIGFLHLFGFIIWFIWKRKKTGKIMPRKQA